jgi:hypothetical protein
MNERGGAVFRRGTTAKATAGPFDKLRAGSSTAQFAKYANCFAQDDNFIV